MNKKTLTIVHYLNQFFGQQGGEDKADAPFLLRQGPVGPGLALQNLLGEKGRVAATLICGDNYFAENLEKAAEEAFTLIAPLNPDLFLPALPLKPADTEWPAEQFVRWCKKGSASPL